MCVSVPRNDGSYGYRVQYVSILGAFAKLRKATISLVLSARLSIGSHFTDFREILYSSTFRNSVEKMLVSLKFDTNNGYFTLISIYLLISRSFVLRMRNVVDKSYIENKNTHFIYYNFFFENRALYEIMWKTWYNREGRR